MPSSGLKSCAASVSSGAQRSSCHATLRTLTWSLSRRRCSCRLQLGSSKARSAPLVACTQTTVSDAFFRRPRHLYAAQAGSAIRNGMPAPASRFLTPAGDARIRADPDRSNGAGSQQFSAMFGGKEYEKMVSLNQVEDCMDIA